MPRSCLTLPRWLFVSILFFFAFLLGRVGRRTFCFLLTRAIISTSLLSASSRFFSWVLNCWAFMTTQPSRVIRLSLRLSSASLMASGKDDSLISNLKWIAEDTLLTFWPPGPCARIALTSISSRGIDMFGVIASMVRSVRAKRHSNPISRWISDGKTLSGAYNGRHADT
jgi:hypothetical protein